ncbi:MAG: glycosyltransferase family 4 protein [Terriglobales bacterium]
MSPLAQLVSPQSILGNLGTPAPRRRLAILSTHPIQYHAHWFRALAARPELDLSVFYCYHGTPADQAQAGFGVEFDWDIPLLEGYRYTFLKGAGGKPGNFFALRAPGMAQILARENLDAVLVNGWYYRAAWQAIFACWRMRIPVMARGDSQLASPRGALKRPLKYPVYRCFIPRFDAWLAAGTRSRDYFLHYGAHPQRVFHVPHAIQDDLFQRAAEQAEPRRRRLRQQWGLEDQQTVFVFAGKFIEKKRPMDFLQAIEAAAKQPSAIAGLMVGDGPLRAACEQFVCERQLPVRFAGFLNQSRMVDAYVAADCLVLPSDARETWGLVVNEAMSCARPAIVSDAVGCAPDLVRDGRSGAIFPLGDVEALSKILAALAGSPERLHLMGERARASLRPYSDAAAVQGVVDAVEAVTRNRRTR